MWKQVNVHKHKLFPSTAVQKQYLLHFFELESPKRQTGIKSCHSEVKYQSFLHMQCNSKLRNILCILIASVTC